MKSLFRSAIVVAAFITLLTALSTSAGPLQFDQMPEGLPEQRANATSGVLGSNFRDPWAIYYQSLLDRVESKAYGLAQTSVLAPTVQAEQTYYVESIALGFVRALLNDQSIRNAHERMMLLYRSIQIYHTARMNGERVFEIMIREIDRAQPGTSGIQLPRFVDDAVVYSPNYRLEQEIPAEQRVALYAQKRADFLAAGGNLADIKILSPETIRPLPQMTMMEFVEMPNRQVRFTTGSAGHIIMAEGQDVRTAGTLLLVKDRANQPQFVVISNSSGSYKPDMVTVVDFAQEFIRMLGIPADNLILTKGEPTSTQALKILMRAAGQPAEVVRQAVDLVKRDGRLAQETPTRFVPDHVARTRACHALFR